MYIVHHLLEFKYEHLPIKNIQKYDFSNDKKIESYDNKFLSVSLTVLTEYSTIDD